MKTKTIKVTAVALSAAVVLGIGGSAVLAKNNEVKPAPVVTSVSVAPAENAGTPAKDETVYVLADANGLAKQIIVSDWLRNPDKADVLSDRSNLAGIENVKGDEEFSVGPDGMLTWNANGQDIYYQGSTDQEIPVEMEVTYTLDGQTISPEELAGKSGHVTMRFAYRNKQVTTAVINGKKQNIHVPFVMVTGTILDTDVFRNVTVTNGKLENMGNQMIVLGIALPGMQENLNLDKKDLEIPEYVEISADVEDFDMGPVMTLATTSLFSNLKSKDLDINELKDQAKKLTDGMNQLMDGSNKLYDGLNTLLAQAQVLVSGVNQLANGATKLQAGADALNGGASQLQAGASQLSEGLSMLDSNSASLNDGARPVFNTLLSSAGTQLNAAGLSVPELSIDNYAEVLGGVIASLDETAVYQSALQQVTAGVNARRDEITAAVTDVVSQQVSTKVTAQVTAVVRDQVQEAVQAQKGQFEAAVIQQATGMTTDQYQAAVEAGLVSAEQQAAVDAAVEAAMAAEVGKQMDSEEIQGKISAVSQQTTAEKMASEEIAALIAENVEIQVEKAISDTMASEEVQAQLQAAAEGARSVIALKSSLDSYNGFYLGVLAYTSGVSSATAGSKDLIAGADALKGGMSSLSSGADDLNSGIQAMKGKTPALIDGVTALRDGSGELKDGLTKLMNEGIRKIADLAEKDLTDLTARLSAVIDAGQSYSSFSGIGSDMEGMVKFIYKTDSISAR